MPRTISLGAHQPAITPNPQKGEPVTSDQFSVDFSVEVEQDGCYVIAVVLKEHRTIVDDDVILSSVGASAQPICIHAGTPLHVRATTSAMGPGGSPPRPAGTTVIDTLSGRWPTHASSSGEFYVEIEVFRVADCPPVTPMDCVPVQRESLQHQNRYMIMSGAGSTTDRELAPAKPPPSPWPRHRGKSAGRYLVARAGGDDLFEVTSAPITVAVDRSVELELQSGTFEDTFGEHGVLVRRFETTTKGRRLSASVALKDTYGLLEALGKALARGERAAAEIRAGKPRRVLGAILAETGVVRHGRATLFHVEKGPLTTFFVDNRAFNGLYRGEIPRCATFLTGLLASGATPPPALPAPEEEDVSVGFPDDFELELSVHLFAPIVNLGARIALEYADDIDEMITDVFDPMITENKCIKRLRIHSHGGRLVDAGGVTTGSFIRMGEDTLESTQFDASGAPLPNTPAAKLLAKLALVMCHPSEIVFDACLQGVGELLRNLSKALGPDRTVKGYSDGGVPWGEGDRTYRDGVQILTTRRRACFTATIVDYRPRGLYTHSANARHGVTSQQRTTPR